MKKLKKLLALMLAATMLLPSGITAKAEEGNVVESTVEENVVNIEENKMSLIPEGKSLENTTFTINDAEALNWIDALEDATISIPFKVKAGSTITDDKPLLSIRGTNSAGETREMLVKLRHNPNESSTKRSGVTVKFYDTNDAVQDKLSFTGQQGFSVDDNQWHVITLSADKGNGWYVYLDETCIQNKLWNGGNYKDANITASWTPTSIVLGNANFNGKIKNVIVHNSVLTMDKAKENARNIIAYESAYESPIVARLESGYSQSRVIWEANRAADGYRVFRAESENGNYTERTTEMLGKDVLEYVDADVEQGKTYYYIVKAYANDKCFSESVAVKDMAIGFEAMLKNAALNKELKGEDREFNGSEVVNVSESAGAIHKVGAGSIIIWFKTTEAAANESDKNAINVLFGAKDKTLTTGDNVDSTGLSQTTLCLVRNDNKDAVRFAYNHTRARGNKSGNASLTDGKWHCAILSSSAIMSDRAIRLVIDGAISFTYGEDNCRGMFNKQPVLDQVTIGGHLNGTTVVNGFKGSIAQIVVTSEELTDAEVKAFSASTARTTYMKFEDALVDAKAVVAGNVFYTTKSLEAYNTILDEIENRGLTEDSTEADLLQAISNMEEARNALVQATVSIQTTANTEEVGEVTTGSGYYETGDVVTISAEEVDGYYFAGWSNGKKERTFDYTVEAANTQNIETVTFTANYAKREHPILAAACIENTEDSTIMYETIAAELTGPGVYAEGETAVLTAPILPGYTFLGWYKATVAVDDSNNSTVTAKGEQVTRKTTCKVEVEAGEASYAAVYEKKADTKVNVTLTGLTGNVEYVVKNGEVTKDSGRYSKEENEEQVYNRILECSIGDTVILTAADDCAGWKNTYGVYMNRDNEYAFKVTGAVTLTPVFNTATTESALVIFESFYGQELERVTVAGQTVTGTIPTAPTRYGYKVVGWDVNVKGTTGTTVPRIEASEGTELSEAVRNYITTNVKVSDIVTLKAVYIEDEAQTCKITVKVGEQTTTDTYTLSKVVTVSAAEEVGEEGNEEYFSHWVDSKGNIMSYNAKYSFYAATDITLEAVYVTAEEDKETPVGVTEILKATKETVTVGENTLDKMTFVSLSTVPSGYTIHKAGVIVALEEHLQGRELTEKTAQRIAGDDWTGTTYRYTYTVRKTAGKNICARAYLVYSDEEGTMYTVYGDVVTDAAE